MKPKRIAITADLHWGVRPQGDEATRLLAEALAKQPPDLLILAGDIGTCDHFAECLNLFRDLDCTKALVPGNHDLWVEYDDPRGDSMSVYEDHLPVVCRDHWFHYLDNAPLFLDELAIVGTINWYDYSWSIDRLKAATPDWEERLKRKIFSRGRHNDYNFIRWNLDDERFTRRVVRQFRNHLVEAFSESDQAIVVTHHPAFFGLNFPPRKEVTLDRMLWDAFSGNRELEALLEQHQGRIPFAFSGHTHHARENRLGEIHGYNIGGDYHFKRLIRLEWPEGNVKVEEFWPGT